jgi:hypothetical protein
MENGNLCSKQLSYSKPQLLYISEKIWYIKQADIHDTMVVCFERAVSQRSSRYENSFCDYNRKHTSPPKLTRRITE